MEPGSGVKHSSDPEKQKTSHPVRAHAEVLPDIGVDLSAEQLAIVELLRVEGCGLTTKQLQSRLPYPGEDVARALGDLIELRLVSQLNTLVPSYAYRSTAGGTGGS